MHGVQHHSIDRFYIFFLKNKFTVLRLIIIFSARCKFLIKNILTLFQLSVLKMLLTYFLLIYLYLLIYLKKGKIKNTKNKIILTCLCLCPCLCLFLFLRINIFFLLLHLIVANFISQK